MGITAIRLDLNTLALLMPLALERSSDFMAKSKYSPKAEKKITKVMKEGYAGELHSGSKKGPLVTSPKQMKAIALSEARKAGFKVPSKKK